MEVIVNELFFLMNGINNNFIFIHLYLLNTILTELKFDSIVTSPKLAHLHSEISLFHTSHLNSTTLNRNIGDGLWEI